MSKNIHVRLSHEEFEMIRKGDSVTKLFSVEGGKKVTRFPVPSYFKTLEITVSLDESALLSSRQPKQGSKQIARIDSPVDGIEP